MTPSELRENLRLLVEQYFTAATVVYGEVDMVKPQTPLVTLKTGSVSRPLQPIMEEIDGVPTGFYPSRTVLEVNLFTKGKPISVPEGITAPLENTAVNDLLEFANFANSPHTIDWCCARDIAIMQKGDVLDVSALLNNSKWEYRAMIEFDVDFLQIAIGAAGILAESSIVYDPEHPNDPISIVPTWDGPTPSGGGSAALAAEETGYFEAVEIIEETEENET